jgi:hypothetical protein
MESQESWLHFWYLAQGKNLIQTALAFIFLLLQQSAPETQFSANPVILQKVISPKPLIGWWQVNTHWKD